MTLMALPMLLPLNTWLDGAGCHAMEWDEACSVSCSSLISLLKATPFHQFNA